MELRFTYPKKWGVVTYVFSAIFCAIGVIMLYSTFDELDKGRLWVDIVFGLAMICLGVYCSVSMFYSQIIITHQSITYNSGWRKKQLLLRNIKGYRLNGKYLVIFPNQKESFKIIISDLIYWDKPQQLKYWLGTNLVDLNRVDFNLESEEIANNNRLGITDVHRLKRAAVARKVAGGLLVSSVILVALTVYVLPVGDWLIVINIAFPVFCVLVMLYYKGLIKFDGKENGAYPTIAGAMMLSALGMAIKAMLNYNLYSYAYLWIITALVALIIIILIDRITINELRTGSKTSRVVYMGIIAVSLAFGGITMINCYYDKSKPVTYKAVVIKKHSSFDKIMTYHFELSAWANKTAGEEETVSSDLYDKVSEKDSVSVCFQKGALDIPWYYIVKL